jgi:hypothetical protein
MWSSARAGRRKAAIRASVWLVLAIAYFGAVLLHQPGVYDEGLIVCGAERVAHGQVPYRDFYTGYPPAQFYTIAAVFRAFGTTLLAERVWDTLWRMAIVGLVCVLVGRPAGRRPHPLPLICVGIFTGAADFHLYPMISGTLFGVGALWCATRYLYGHGIRWLWLSGLVAGAGVLYRHDLLFCVCAAVTIAVSYQAIAERKGGWLRAPAVFLAGVLLILAPLVLAVWSAVPHDVLRQAFFEFPMTNAAARRLPLPVPSIPALGDFYLPLAIVVVSAASLRWTSAAQRPVMLLWLLSGGLTLGLATQRLDTVHAYPAILFSLVLLSWHLAEPESRNQNIWSSVWRAAVLCVVLLCYGIVPLVLWRSEVADVMRLPPSEIARAGPVRLEPDQQEAIQYIQRHLPAGKPLYVGTATHRRAYFNDALFYFLADRPQVTRFDMFLPGVTNVAGGQSAIARDIEEKRVEYVVLFSAPLSHEPNGSSVDSGITLLDDAINKDYTEVAHFGRYAICRRRNSQSESPALAGRTPR